ncbi:low molecular weight phosphatase family protein [Solwaraspora sp. WMMB335]|uniref:arsenate reductase/protein-tyrosine-phosphatase family protein n=1 Tax=Solwaraspora sp. WMMB335 TaxID=3404118 RepID=UPI003B959BF6
MTDDDVTVPDDDRFTILFVCRANICRSPMAERLARHAIACRLGAQAEVFAVHSAGTHALADQPMHPHTERVLRERQADVAGFRSRLVGAGHLGSADLVLTASRRHRAHCVNLAPQAVARTFTVRQFGRLAGAVVAAPVGTGAAVGVTADTPTARARGLITAAAAARSRIQPVSAGQDDLADPVLRPLADFRDCADQISRTLDVLLDLITKP